MLKVFKRLSASIIVFILLFCVGCSTENISIGTNDQGFPVVETLKLQDKKYCTDCSIKFMDSNYSPMATYYITPSGFEMDKLNEKGYSMSITVSYTVYYKKNMLIDIGYLGAPKYELTILNSDGLGKMETDIVAPKSEKNRSIQVSSTIVDLIDQRLTLTFSTDNIQNVIYFKNIVVTYQCYK